MSDTDQAPMANAHGILAEFATPEALIDAVKRTREAGYQRMEAYAPFAVEGLYEALDRPPSRIPYIMLGGGFLGAAVGLGMQYFANLHAYPMNIGGRPLNVWPAFIPPTFELIIFFAVMSGLAALFLKLRLPQIYHPVFNHPEFRRASRDGFFLCIEATDSKFDPSQTAAFLNTLGSTAVEAVEK